MRRAYSDVGWILSATNQLIGVSLGYDRCAEHEWGIDNIQKALGVATPEFPLGVQDRQVTNVPTALRLVEFKYKPQDKRRKAYPVAMLVLLDWYNSEQGKFDDPALLMRHSDATFQSEPGQKWYDPKHDIASSWCSDEFALTVRGEENIVRLRELYAAFQEKDVCLGLPWARSFFRGGISFVIPSRMAEEDRAAVLAQDQAHLDLHLAAEATGVPAALKAAGLECYILTPDWYDREVKSEMIFYMRPKNERDYNSGWYTVSELMDWTQNKGPVMRDVKLESFVKLPENYNWPYRLLSGLEKHGLALRTRAHVVWFDKEKGIPGLYLHMAPRSESKLASGLYAFHDIMAKYADPLPVAEPSAS